MSVFGFLAVVLLYAPVVNLGNIMMMYSEPTWTLFKTSMVMGFPFDIVHAISTAIFLILGFPLIAEKIERIKSKYGILKN